MKKTDHPKVTSLFGASALNRFSPRLTFALCTAIYLSALLDSPSLAQTPVKLPPEASTGAVMLSPFEVSIDKDTGYQAGNTLSGSRFDAPLKDTAAAITGFTKVFLSDFRANSLEDMTAYSPNLMIDIQDRTPAATPSFMGGANGTEGRIRARGLPVGTALDFFETLMPTDNYRVDRVELAVGPNSILFGFANPGGLATTTTKKANFFRTNTSLLGEYGSWGRQRYELDHNQILIPQKLSLRLYGVSEDADGWRRYDFRKNSAGTASLRFDPWKNTKVVANYENGQLVTHITRPWNAQDLFSLWRTSGSPIKDANDFVNADRSLGLSRTTATGYVYVGGPGSSTAPFIFGTSNANNFRVLESQYEDLSVAAINQAGFTLVTPSLLPYNVSAYGPGSTRDSNYDRTFVRIEQKLGTNGILELAFNQEKTTGKVITPGGTSVVLNGDPNSVLPNPNGSSATIANPNAGKMYMSAPWGGDHGFFANRVFRATLGWNWDLGPKFGKHMISALAERGNLEQWRYGWAEILVDDKNLPIFNQALPENSTNRLTRRHYVTPGNFSTYFAGNGQDPVKTTINGTTYHNAVVNTDLGGGDVKRAINSIMFATQSRFWNNRIVVTAGGRIDALQFDLLNGARLPASDARVVSREMVANEWAFNSSVASTYKWRPQSGTLGGVFHVNRFVSVFGNYGSSASQPTFNAINLATRGLNGPSKGVTHDYGFMLNLLQDKAYLRVTTYETSRANWDSIVLSADPMNVVTPINRVITALQQTGRLTTDEFNAHLLPGGVRLLHDIDSKGYEASLGFNPNRNFTAQLNFSKTTSAYSNINLGFEDWFAGESAFLLQKAGAAVVQTTSGLTVQQELSAMPQLMADGRDFYAFAFGERPYKANASGRYTFTNGTLNGLFVGAGARWQSKPKNGRLITGRQANGNAIYGSAVYGPEDFKMDCFFGYKKPFQIRNRKTELSLQLNVRNVTDEDEVMPLRYNNKFSGLSRTQLFDPRNYRLTVGLDF